MCGVHPLGDIASTPRELSFRFWVDEVLWSQGRVAVELVEQVLAEAGGLRTGGPTRSEARSMKRLLGPGGGDGAAVLGSQHMNSWEVLWTKSTYAIPAARAMRPGQLVSAIIGLNSLTMKKRLMMTLREAYGPEAAFQITPRSFALPEELDAWEDCIRRQAAASGAGAGSCGGAGSGGDGGGSGGLEEPLWILKTGQDAGKGLSLLPASEALRFAKQQLHPRQQPPSPHPDGGATAGLSGGSRRQFPLQVAQQYIADPFLIHGRKFHLRLWLLVTGRQPLRAYLHRRGLVLFSSELYDKAAAAPAGRHVAPRGFPRGPHAAEPTPETPPDPSCSRSPSLSLSPAADPKPDGSQLSLLAPPNSSSSTSPSSSPLTSSTPPAPPPSYDLPPSHITNYARNSNTLVWSLSQLADHLGPDSFAALWSRLRRSCGRAVAAARASLEEAHAWLRPAVEEYGFQMMGVDFLLDERLHPWLLEFNSSPSIMVQHDSDQLRKLVYEQKYGMLRDTWEAVRWRVYREGMAGGGGPGGEVARGRAAGAGSGGRSWAAASTGPAAGSLDTRQRMAREAEAIRAGEYDPLMPYMA